MFKGMRGVVLSAQMNLGELRDEITMGPYLFPKALLSFTQTISELMN